VLSKAIDCSRSCYYSKYSCFASGTIWAGVPAKSEDIDQSDFAGEIERISIIT
jgi:hypothetical protein